MLKKKNFKQNHNKGNNQPLEQQKKTPMEEEEKKSKMANEKNTFVRGRLCDREGEGWGPTVLKGRRRSREGGWGDGRSHEGEKEGEGRSRDGGDPTGG